jgi:hypothetical protein
MPKEPPKMFRTLIFMLSFVFAAAWLTPDYNRAKAWMQGEQEQSITSWLTPEYNRAKAWIEKTNGKGW